jgi:hypothetical protein
MYDFLDWFFETGCEYLPWIFLKEVWLDGHQLQLPRWITQKHINTIDAYTQNLMHELNWEETCEDRDNKIFNAGEDDKGNPIF